MLRSQTVLFVLVMLIALAGCRREEAPPPPKVEPANSHGTKKPATLVVPDFVKGKWKAVKIAVTDKSIGKQVVYTIPIGGKMDLPSSTMTIEVEAFLPAFVMEGTNLTSASNQLKNPGAKVRISEKSSLVFNGWLFSRFPNTHAFMHPRYGFALVDVVPAKAQP